MPDPAGPKLPPPTFRAGLRPVVPSSAPSPVTPAAQRPGPETIDILKPTAVSAAAREAVGQRAAEKLFGIAARTKDVRGTGVETAGSGDPRITERRNAISTMIADRTGKFVDVGALEELGVNVKSDIRWLRDAEQREYTLDGRGQFSWSQSNMSSPTQIEAFFKTRVAAGRAQAKDIVDGKRKVLDASDGSVIGASFIEDPSRRAAALTDILLQFRAHRDTTKEKDEYKEDKRIDRAGPPLVAEQRILLATAKLSADDPVLVRELSLLREVISSHPTSSVNSIFDARNAVGSMKADEHTAATAEELDWVEDDLAPGATASAYKSIHHNFSKQTPQNIATFISEFVFCLGEKADRPMIFARLVDAMKLAGEGDANAAREVIKALETPEQRAVVAPLLKRCTVALPAEEMQAEILGFLAQAAVGDWAAFPLQYRLPIGAHTDARKAAATLIGAYGKATKGDVAGARAAVVKLAPASAATDVLAQVLADVKDVPAAELGAKLKAAKDLPEVQALPAEQKTAVVDRLGQAGTRASEYLSIDEALETAANFKTAVGFARELMTEMGKKPDAEMVKIAQDFFARPDIKAMSSYNSPMQYLSSAKERSGTTLPVDDARKAIAAVVEAQNAVLELVAGADALSDADLTTKLKALETKFGPMGVPEAVREAIKVNWSGVTNSWGGVPTAAKYSEARLSLAALPERFAVMAKVCERLTNAQVDEWPGVLLRVAELDEYEGLSIFEQTSVDKMLAALKKTTEKATPGVTAYLALSALESAGLQIEDLFARYRKLPEGDVRAAIASDVRALGNDDGAAATIRSVLYAVKSKAENAGAAVDARALIEGDVARVAMFQPLLAELGKAPDDKVKDALKAFLDKTLVKHLGEHPASNLEMAARMYRAVCASQPTASSLGQTLFKAGDAMPEVADVVARLNDGDSVGVLKELGEARLAMRDAIVNAELGHERHDLILYDAQLARLTCEELGASVDRVGDLATNAQRSEALVAVQTALRAAVASGLHALKDEADPATAKGRPLDQVLVDVDAAIESGKVTESAYRGLMADVSINVARTVQNIRGFIDLRAAELADAGVSCDPEFLDQFVKQSPLHYATALAEKGMRVGLKENVLKGDDGRVRGIENVEGMRVLNGIGPVVFTSALFAENGKDLARLGPTKDQLAVLYHLEEKKMVAVGGLFVDTANAPGGNSHLNMYAMNNGIPVIALPELRTRYAEFFANAQKEGGIYVDDTGAEFKMMTVDMAVESGLIKVGDPKNAAQVASAIEKLRPGMNRNITFLKPTDDATGFTIAAKHDATFSAQRGTRQVEIYLPQDEVKGIGKECPTWEELATLGIHARHLAGEKGTVLALLSSHPELSKYVPKGSQVTPAVVKDMLSLAKDAQGKSLLDLWQGVWADDPAVGVVDDANFVRSEFYTNPKYRRDTRERLQAQTKDLLTGALIGDDGQLTKDGDRIYQQLVRNPALANDPMWILRSSFTAEDRPGKSGAGQYESFVDKQLVTDKPALKAVHKAFDDAAAALMDAHAGKLTGTKTQADVDAAQAVVTAAVEARNAFLGPARVQALIGVIESTWMAEPIENNVAEQFFLKHVGPTVAVQQTVDPDISGVMISRNLESGARQEVSFQLVPGFGGGVEGGKTTEGVIGGGGARVAVTNGVEGAAAEVLVGDVKVTAESMAELKTIVLKTEKYFNEVLEKGKRYAVDMEVARDRDDGWKIVQARVILVDK